MKKDILFIALLLALVLPFLLSEQAMAAYGTLNGSHPYLLAFVKFAILATLGEMLGLRIRQGIYNYQGFGLLPRFILWGFYGVWVAAAMKNFAAGAPVMVESFGVKGIVAAMGKEFSLLKLVGSFSISVMMNSLFAPVFMTLHKITDAHIIANGGSIGALVKPINMLQSVKSLDWNVQWGFVIRKTIPYFWVPAHTITFLLPPTNQVLFAALLSIALGTFLSVAARIKK